MPAFLAQVWIFSSWVATSDSKKAVKNLVTKNFFAHLAYLKKNQSQIVSSDNPLQNMAYLYYKTQ